MFPQSLIYFVITLIIIGVLLWAAQKLIALIPMNDTIRQVVLVLVTVFLLIWLLYAIMGLIGGGLSFPVYSRPLVR